MNIVTPYPAINLNTANVYTESARRDNQLREVIPAPQALNKSATENKSASDADKAKAPGQTKESQDSLKPQNEEQRAVGERDDESSQQDSSRQDEQQQKEQQQIEELSSRDSEVRLHEQAHATVGGRYAGSPSYEFQRGPDGKNYAVGGEVQIDVAAVPGDPRATIEKMQQVRAAALAPAEPSAADRAIARDATQKLVQAQTELASQTKEEAQSGDDDKPAYSVSEPPKRFTREDAVESRALRIADFYQQVSKPSELSAVSTQV
ncbi:putative metalloprotease CJM1_0395 family protein [Pseudoalteromonas sp. SSDWG2]|uniref:putative metalloprotease CJM1_0395 family protein n=1 Tax=Pseudoalteromonas sp. SSDWG2 TaxID=3139391 RepID=UPI003BAB9C91